MGSFDCLTPEYRTDRLSRNIITNNHPTMRNIADKQMPQIHCDESLKSRIILWFIFPWTFRETLNWNSPKQYVYEIFWFVGILYSVSQHVAVLSSEQSIERKSNYWKFLYLTSNLWILKISYTHTHTQGRIKLFGAPRQWKNFRPLFQAVFLSGGCGYYPPDWVKHHASQSQDRYNKYFILYIEFVAADLLFRLARMRHAWKGDCYLSVLVFSWQIFLLS